jgi:hypothetical protein
MLFNQNDEGAAAIRQMKLFTFMAVAAVIAFWGATGFVAWHFISKYW